MRLACPSHAMKTTAVRVVRAVTHAQPVTALPVVDAVPKEPKPHRWMAATNPLKPLMHPKPPLSAFEK